MNKRIYIPAMLLLVAMLVSGCGFQVISGSGKLASETRNLSGFTSVTLAGIGNVYLTQGPAESIRIEAEDNLIPYFDTSVQGTTLKIGIKDQYMGASLQPTRPVKFYVTLPKLEAVTLAGSGNIFAGKLQTGAFRISLLGSGDISTDNLAATDLDIHLGGSGNISLGTVSASQVTARIAGSGDIQLGTLTADNISSQTAGSGNITIGGKVNEQSTEILGSGDYLAGGLKSATATVRVTGSGDSQVSASGALNVTILGSGDVAYSGSPKLNASIAGSGKVNPASQ
jgi:predicted small secreted protein